MKKETLRAIKLIFIALTFTSFLSTISYAEPFNLSILRKDIEHYHSSGQYAKEIACVISKAQNYILQQVYYNEQHGNKRKLAIVLDIDETSLSNYNYMVKRQFVANRAQFHQDVLAADAPAITPTLALFRNAQKHGIKIFFVTGRPQTEFQATKTNLLRAGYNHWAGLYLKPDTYKQTSIIPFKAQVRETISKKGYTIVASIGDQLSDLKGGYAQKGFKLPNPFYYIP